jgi:hypothetical protein
MKQIFALFVLFLFCELEARLPSASKANFANQSSNSFEKNLGQVQGKDKELVNYFFKSGNLTVFLTKKGLTYQFDQWENTNQESDKKLNYKHESYRMDMELCEANYSAQIIEEEQVSSYTNYYNFNILNVNSYKKITYKNIYPNIDWVIYFSTPDSKKEEFLKYDFVVHPEGDPNQIKLKIKWAEELYVDDQGNLQLINSLGKIMEAKPISFQDRTVSIESSFKLNDDILSFDIGHYDKSKTLTIDPLLQWATYYGGAAAETGGFTAIDGSGFVYLCGATATTTAIASGGHQTSFGGVNDAFLVKFNSAGIRQWATYYGGTDDDRGTYCHVDKNNNVYLCGRTLSTAGIASGGHQTTVGGDYDGFLVKFNPAGVRQWSTYYGGGNNEDHTTCATDTGLNVYMAGTTESNNNIFATGGFQSTFGNLTDAYLVKFNSSGARQWGTYYGGSNFDDGAQCAVDKLGSVYLCGTTRSTTSISASGFQNTKNNARDGFLVKFNPNGTRQWATYYGGPSDDYTNSVCVDTSLNIYISGFTYSTSSIANGGFQNTFGGSNDAYLVKFSTSGSRLWGTYYGGTSGDYGPHCITDKFNNVYLTGYTLSTNAIAFAGIKNVFGGGVDGFIAKFNANGTRFWGSYYGGTNDDYLFSSVPDGFGNIYYSGPTISNALISSGGHQNTYGGAGDTYLVKMSEDPIPYIEIFSNKGDTICQGDSILFTRTDVNGGSNPKYRWFRNNTLVDTTISYKGGNFSTGDSVKCLMISNAAGLLYDSAWSLTIRFFVHPKKFTTLNIQVCRPQTYFFKGQQRNATGLYIDTLASSKGCDSIITLNFTVKDTISFNRFDTICSNQSLLFNGILRTITGVYKDTFIASNNCDSFVYMHLFIKSASSKSIDTSICPKNPYFFNGFWRTSSGAYLDTLVNSKGCDSFITLNLTVKTNSTKTIDTALCSGFSYWFKSQNRTTTGTYRDTLTNSLGCDSFVILNLTIKALSFTNLTATICDNQSYIFKGIPRTTAGIYKDTLSNSLGCDSIVTLTLTVNSRTYRTIFDTICSNQTYSFDGKNLNLSGTYYDTIVNSKNCDSIVTLNLFVKSISTFSFNQSICSNSSYFFNGMNRTAAGVYLDTLVNSKDCDSFVTLNLTVKSTSLNSYNEEICIGDSSLFNGIYRKVSGIYFDTLVNSEGCDSFVTLTLTVRNPSFYNFSISQCKNYPYFFNNQFLTASGIYKDTLLNQYNCDSFITLNYTAKDTSNYTYSVSICQGANHIFNGIPRSSAGIYKFSTINAQGCDSFVTLNLTVNPIYTKIIDTSICNGNSVFFKGNFLTIPGTYYDSLKTINNCDSVTILILKNFPPSQNTVYRKFCNNSGVWFNGNYITIAGSYKDTLINSRGCDSFLTMVLIRDTAHNTFIARFICSYDSFYFGRNYLRTAGDYSDTLKNFGGCDSIVNLKLVVHTPKPISLTKYNATVLISEIGFSSYNWYLNKTFLPTEKRHYIEINTSGIYQVYGLDSNSCLSKSNEFTSTISSIQENDVKLMRIYPNPISDKLTIELPQIMQKPFNIIIKTIEGRTVFQKLEFPSNQKIELVLNSLDTGVYFIELIWSDYSLMKQIYIKNNQ